MDWRRRIPLLSPITSFAAGWRTALSSVSNSDQPGPPTVLCAGIAVGDFLFRVDRFPEPGSKVQADALAATIGGCAANSSVTVALLGGRSRVAGPGGTDEASSRVLAGLYRRS